MVNIDSGGGGRLGKESISPRIGDVEPITMQARYQLPWNRKSNQTACGTTIQVPNGDLNWRIVIEGVISLEQFREINDMRGEDTVEVVTAAFGKKEIAFDQFDVERTDDEDVGDIDGKVGPLFSFQLQTKELEDDQEEGLFG